MSFYSLFERIVSLIFPLRKESQIFINWSVEDYLENLPCSNFNDSGINALFSYKDKNVRALIRSLKKEKVLSIRDCISAILSDEILSLFNEDSIAENQKLFVVPIPMSKSRLKERGFNQADWIARGIVNILGDNFIYSPNMLYKIKETKKQALLTRTNRLKNPIGSFRAGNIKSGEHIILIDDVITTGATVNEAKRVLKKAGAKKVDVFCIAH